MLSAAPWVHRGRSELWGEYGLRGIPSLRPPTHSSDRATLLLLIYVWKSQITLRVQKRVLQPRQSFKTIEVDEPDGFFQLDFPNLLKRFHFFNHLIPVHLCRLILLDPKQPTCTTPATPPPAWYHPFPFCFTWKNPAHSSMCDQKLTPSSLLPRKQGPCYLKTAHPTGLPEHLINTI